MPSSSSQPLLELDGIEKSFAGVPALRPVSFALQQGETLGLIGENGAGKSTLIKILSGVHSPCAGSLRWHGRDVHFKSPHHALRAGIATIHQEIACFPHLSVAENLLMHQRWPRFAWGGVRWNLLHSEARRRLHQFGIATPSDRRFALLSSAQKQEIAIARALSHDAQLLILDEPTASLSEPEVETLFQHLKRLRAQNVALIYISHRLDEIQRLADRVLVLRDGALAAQYPASETTIDRMVRDMVGRPLDQVYPHARSGKLGPPLLELRDVSKSGFFHNVTFEVGAGEIVGLAGLVGAGRSELARAIYGLYPIDNGTMRLCGAPWCPRNPSDAVQAGLVYVPEERKRQGLVLEHSLEHSITAGFSELLARCGWIPPRAERSRANRAIRQFGIRARHPAQPIGVLSGGNQQKALLARWLERDPKVIILDEPTRGVDVGAKAEIHALMDQLAARGHALLLISSDLPEAIGMSDRLLVLYNGALQAELAGAANTQENVLLAASGLPIKLV